MISDSVCRVSQALNISRNCVRSSSPTAASRVPRQRTHRTLDRLCRWSQATLAKTGCSQQKDERKMAAIDGDNGDFGIIFHDFDFDPIWNHWPSLGRSTVSPRPVKWPEFGDKDSVSPLRLPAFHARAIEGWITIPLLRSFKTYERSPFQRTDQRLTQYPVWHSRASRAKETLCLSAWQAALRRRIRRRGNGGVIIS